jgi:GT2 family glycosyltransferase
VSTSGGAEGKLSAAVWWRRASGAHAPHSTDVDLTAYDPAVPLSAIVVNWNGRAHLEVCLGSLRRQTLPGIEIVLVDNASSDDSLALVGERFGTAVRIVALPDNRGYAGGLNAGIAAARGRYLLPLNSDTELAPDCCARLVAAADAHPSTGLFAPKILAFDDRTRIDNVGHWLYPDGLSRGRGRLEIDHGQYDADEEIVLPSGCAVLLRRAMLADVGVFDEDLFAYLDDTDLGLRARLAGWRCRAVPGAVVYHKYSAASGAYSPLKAFLVERNRAWVALKCLPAPLLLASPLFTLARLAGQAWGALTHRGAAGRFAAAQSPLALIAVLLRAYAAAARGAPATWRKRRAVQRRRRVSAWEPVAWLRRWGMGVREVALKD